MPQDRHSRRTSTMWISITFFTLLSLFIFISLILILLVLIQKGRGGGLASAFGGMGGNTAFGSKTGDVLTWTTAIVFGVFLSLASLLNWTAAARHRARSQSASSLIHAPAQNSGAAALPSVESPTPLPATAPSANAQIPRSPASP